MPDHEVHDYYDFLTTGCPLGEYHWLHELIDQPWQRMFGKRHRKVMHDDKMVQWVTNVYGPVAGQIARGHLIVDLTISLYAKRQRQYFKERQAMQGKSKVKK